MIPLEIITLIGGGVSGAFFKYLGMSMENKKLQTQLLLDRANVEHEIRKDLMEGPKRGNKEFQWTKRAIALSTVFSVIVLPKIASLLTDAPQVVYGTAIETSAFLWFGSTTAINWTVMNGIPITPVDVHATMCIIGMYFGSSITGSKS